MNLNSPKIFPYPIALLILLVLGITYWVYGINPPPSQNKKNNGYLETTLFLASGEGESKGKVNRLGQKRNLTTIIKTEGKAPHELEYIQEQKNWGEPQENQTLGENTPFPPLLVVKTKGKKGKITLEGNLFTQKTTKDIIKDEETLIIHPEYNWIREKEGINQETLTLNFTGEKGSPVQQYIEIEWSGPSEIFLADNCLPHLVALTDTKANPIIKNNISALNPSKKDIIDWIKQTVLSLEPYQITYEAMPENVMEKKGWQKIRTPQEILKEHKGNCLDLSIFWAGLMLGQNLQTWVVILPEHAMVAVGPPNSNPSEAIAIETTWLTEKGLNPQEVDNAIQQGKKRIQEELKKNPNSIKIIDVNYWKTLFEENTL